MAGSLPGVGSQQQIPLANTFKPGLQPSQENKNPVQESASSERSSVRNLPARDENPISQTSREDEDRPARRGSVVDITV